MKGYRTIAFAVATILLGLIGKHAAPELINEYLDVIFAGVGLGFMGLRLVTTTPLGLRVAADLGTTPAALQGLLATIDPDVPASLNSAVTDLNTAIGTLTGHLPAQQSAIDALTGLAASLASSTSTGAAQPQATIQAQDQPQPLASVATVVQAPAAVVQPQPVPQPAPAPIVAQ